MGELTEVASAKRAVRGDRSERLEEELEVRGLPVAIILFFSSDGGGVVRSFPDISRLKLT